MNDTGVIFSEKMMTFRLSVEIETSRRHQLFCDAAIGASGRANQKLRPTAAPHDGHPPHHNYYPPFKSGDRQWRHTTATRRIIIIILHSNRGVDSGATRRPPDESLSPSLMRRGWGGEWRGGRILQGALGDRDRGRREEGWVGGKKEEGGGYDDVILGWRVAVVLHFTVLN